MAGKSLFEKYPFLSPGRQLNTIVYFDNDKFHVLRRKVKRG